MIIAQDYIVDKKDKSYKDPVIVIMNFKNDEERDIFHEKLESIMRIIGDE